MMVVPFSCSLRMISNSRSVSFADREEVGSSKIRILASKDTALTISTICCCAMGRLPTLSVTLNPRPSSSIICWVRRLMFFQS